MSQVTSRPSETARAHEQGATEAFSDGVMAILITIMVLELEISHGGQVGSLAPLVPVFLTYVGSLGSLRVP